MDLIVQESDLDDDLDRGIGNYTVSAIDDKWLSIDISFKDPFAISKFVTDPDFLDIRIKKPDLFISAETGLKLAAEDAFASVNLITQTTEE